MEPFAIVGFSFKLPQEAEEETSFWNVLENRKNLMTDWPETRANVEAFYDPDTKQPNMLYCRGAHFLREDPGVFDAPFFSITAKEAAAMDPQQRQVLEASYLAFENAGIPVESLRGSDTAVYGASMTDDYARLLNKDADVMPRQGIVGVANSTLPNRVSWYFDLRGPSVHIDTACSSGMIGLDMAIQAMSAGDASTALVVGCNALLTPEISFMLGNLNFLSPDSRCYSFDARANGYARGEGVVALVVKPLKAALEAGDVIRAVIRATASNQDGRTPALTQPSTEAQEALIRHVYKKAGLSFAETRYFEAHGTGTPTGDPIEMKAIGRVFRKHRSPEEPLYVGSVKANIGHLEGASGLAGVVKSIMMLEKGLIPPNALFENMNPDIDADFFNVQIPTTTISWPNSGLRRISVNSFGFGGANAHVILDDSSHYLHDNGLSGHHNTSVNRATNSDTNGTTNGASNGHTNGHTNGHHNGGANGASNGSTPSSIPKLLVWTAADVGATQRMLQAYQSYFKTQIAGNNGKLEQLAYTLAARRSIMSWRSFAVVDAATGDGINESPIPVAQPIRASRDKLAAAYVFTGQGAQYVDMGLELSHYAIFKESLDKSDAILAKLGCAWAITDALHSEERINRPEVSQPLCTVLQIALVELLRSFGVAPVAVVGHSSGEIAAAYTIGALSHESACKVAYYRGQLAGQLVDKLATTKPGAMLSVNLTATEAPAYLEKVDSEFESGAVTIACFNSPTNLTLSGQLNAIDALKAELDSKGIFAHKVNTGVAYHSAAMHDVAADYVAAMGTLEADTTNNGAQAAPMVSSVTGKEVARNMLVMPQYWVDNLVSPVRFADAVQHVANGAPALTLPFGTDAVTDLVEIGPHAALKRPVKENAKALRYHAVLERNKSALKTTQALVGTLFCHGFPVSVLAVNGQELGHPSFLVDCPRYPFDHSRIYWTESRLSKDFRFRTPTPGYLLGRQAHDWNPLQPRYRNWLYTETLPWLGGHTVNDNVICPGTGMLVMALEAVKLAAAKKNATISGFRVKGAEFLAPIRVGETAQDAAETELHLQPILRAYEKDAAWSEIKIFEHYNGRTTECFRARVQMEFENETKNQVDGGLESRLEHDQIREHVQQATDSCTQALDSATFYKFCDDHGLKYGEAFSLLRGIGWDGQDLSTAHIDLASARKNWQAADSPVHPAVLDAALHLTMVQLSKGLQGQTPTPIPHKLANMWISAKTWDRTTSTVHLSCLVRNDMARSSTVDSTIYALADDGSPLCAIENLTMAEVSKPNELDERGAADATLLYNIAWKPQLSSLGATELQQLIDSVRNSSGKALHGTENFSAEFIAASAEPFTIKSYPKMESALRIAARRALLAVPDDQLSPELRYLPTYVASLKALYGTKKSPEEGEDPDDAAFETLLRDCESEQPDWLMFAAVARALPSVLRGETDPLELVFANRGAELCYRHMYDNHMLDGRFQSFFDLVSHETPGLKILEVGAGTGGMTRNVLATLRGLEAEAGQTRFAEYTYTDISAAFFETARGEFEESTDRMVFKTLNIEKDPAKEGFELSSYDVILAGSVLHATANLETTLRHVRALLKPGGYIVFQEVVAPDSTLGNVGFGCLGGWWLSTEDWRKTSPLATEEQWDRLLRVSGFSGTELTLRDYESDLCHISSIIVSKAAAVEASNGAPDNHQIVVLLDQNSATQAQLATEIGQNYSHSRKVTISDILSDGWAVSETDIVISLLEVGTPLLASLSEQEFGAVQQLLKSIWHMVWVTAVSDPTDVVGNARYSLATGFLRCMRSEDSNKHIVTLAIESYSSAKEFDYVRSVVDSCFLSEQASSELEFIVRDGHLNIARVAQEIELDQERVSRIVPQMRTEAWKSGPHLALEVGTPGMLDSLHYIEDTVHGEELDPDEVEIEAMAWPVSFRDIFIALGRLGKEGLGFECAGYVTRTGTACSTDFPLGSRVLMVIEGCMYSHPRAPAHKVIAIPDSLSFNDAVAAVNPGLTAYHALVNVARLQPGEKILIHSAAGSTGQMAVGIAKMLGAEIFATVGFDDKKQLLVDHFGVPESNIFYSRDTSFARGIMRLAGGVDVVVNSLAGEGLRASWECIAPYGRFIEIGKADIRANSTLPMAHFAKNCSFAAVDMVHFAQTRAMETRDVVQKVLDLIAQGTISSPVPLNLYPAGDVEKAFRYMQSGKNSGRIIVTMSEKDEVMKSLIHKSTWQFDANASYIIAGGLGGIGRATARWMADRGAKHLILLSRSGASTEVASALVAELTARSVQVSTPRCDVSSREDLSAVLKHCSETMPPIRGCINGAMALQDAIFENMTYAQWSTTIGSKVKASWNLHELLPKDMDFFILLSSLAGLYGPVGQSNYAAGCTFQDALARARTAAGFRGSVALDLGWMATIGIIAEREDYQHNRKGAGDMAPVSAEDYMAVLERYCDPGLSALELWQSQLLVGPVTPAHFHARAEELVPTVGRPIFAAFNVASRFAGGCGHGGGAGAAARDDTAVLFQQASGGKERSAIVVEAIKAKLARALGVAADEIDSLKKLSDYGVDSLMAVELRNWIRRDFRAAVAVFEMMGGATIAEVAALVTTRAE